MIPETYARGATAAGTTVVLRGWTDSDLDTFRGWLRPEHDWHRWDGPYYPVPTAEQADALVASLAQDHGLRTDGLPPRRLVVDVGGELVGTVAWYWESRETEWARTGVTVYDPAVRGHGIGRTALELWTTFLFASTAWVRLDFATWSGNEAMLGVGRALGFVEEARFRRARVVDGVRYDSVVMGVLRDEWQEPATSPNA